MKELNKSPYKRIGTIMKRARMIKQTKPVSDSLSGSLSNSISDSEEEDKEGDLNERVPESFADLYSIHEK
jgi:hypothetical protein